jgi:hypothetical protein
MLQFAIIRILEPPTRINLIRSILTLIRVSFDSCLQSQKLRGHYLSTIL